MKYMVVIGGGDYNGGKIWWGLVVKYGSRSGGEWRYGSCT